MARQLKKTYNICTLQFIPDYLKTQSMCEKAVEKNPLLLKYIPDWYKTKGMRDEVESKTSCLLEYVPLSVQDDDSEYF